MPKEKLNPGRKPKHVKKPCPDCGAMVDTRGMMNHRRTHGQLNTMNVDLRSYRFGYRDGLRDGRGE